MSDEERLEQDLDRSVEFKLERYKYILQQLTSLNDTTQKYLSLYQTLTTAIIGAGVAVFVGWKDLAINAATARVGITALLGLLVALTLFVVISLLSGIFSWIDYRREEVRLLNDEVGPGFRELPKLRNAWRWYETWLIAFLVTLIVLVFLFVEYQVIPLIQ